MATTNDSVQKKADMRNWIALIGCILGAFMAILDIQVTNASLKDIQGTLNATSEEISWISTSYLVAEIIVIPLSGWLAQVFSLRYYLMISSVFFVIFSVLCGLAWDINSMIIFRALQGLFGGAMIPLAQMAMIILIPPAKRPIAGALFGITVTFAPTIGPTLGGYLTDAFGWEYIFFINLIPGIIMSYLIWNFLPQTPTKKELLKYGDWWGITFMALGLGGIQIVLEEGNKNDWFNSNFIIYLTIFSVISLALFLWIELTNKKPFINLRVLKNRNFAMASIVNTSVGLGLYGSVFIMPLYLGQIQGYNALEIGKVLMWVGLPQLFMLPLLPRLISKVDMRFLVAIGVTFFGASCIMNSNMTNLTGSTQLIISQIIRALGQPLIMIPLTNLAIADISMENAGSASGLFNMMRNLGGSVGIAMLSTILTKREQLHSAVINENISLYSPKVVTRIDELTQFFVSKGSDIVTAKNQALLMIGSSVRREAFVMAFNDCFMIVGLALFASGVTILFLKKAKPSGKPSVDAH